MDDLAADATLVPASPVGKFYRFIPPSLLPQDIADIPKKIRRHYRSHPALAYDISSEVGKEGWWKIMIVTSRPRVDRVPGWVNYIPVGQFESPNLAFAVYEPLVLCGMGGGPEMLKGRGESWVEMNSWVKVPGMCLRPWYHDEEDLGSQYKLDAASVAMLQGLLLNLVAGEVSPDLQKKTIVTPHLGKPLDASANLLSTAKPITHPQARYTRINYSPSAFRANNASPNRRKIPPPPRDGRNPKISTVLSINQNQNKNHTQTRRMKVTMREIAYQDAWANDELDG